MKRILLALVAVSVATTAFADPAATYKAKCAMCHGQSGEGGAMAKKPIKGAPEQVVLKAINEGKGPMKPLRLEDAAEVAKYVAGLK